MLFEHGRECVRIRAARTYNPATGENDRLDWSDDAVDRLPLPGSVIAPSSQSVALAEDEHTAVIRMSFYGAVDADVQHLDHLIDPGLVDDEGHPIVWQIAGDLVGGSWTNPFTGWQAGSEIPLEQAR